MPELVSEAAEVFKGWRTELKEMERTDGEARAVAEEAAVKLAKKSKKKGKSKKKYWVAI